MSEALGVMSEALGVMSVGGCSLLHASTQL